MMEATQVSGAPSSQVQVTFDCADPRALSLFWSDVLGYELPPPPPGFDSWDAFARDRCRRSTATARPPARTPTGAARGCSSSGCPRARRSKNRVHLDVRAAPGLEGDERMAALEAECERLVGLGATRVRAARAGAADERRPHRDAGPRGQRVLPRLRPSGTTPLCAWYGFAP